MTLIPVIHDTDIGSDIDDAVALAYLICQPRCELVGVTTVSGESEKRAMLADALCQAGGLAGIPVHAGTEAPLIVEPLQPLAPQAEVLTERWPHRRFEKRNTAVDFLRETIRARPGEIVLLATGPLTNIALLFAIDPEIPTLLRQLVMMGGVYYTRGYDHTIAEWNIRCDPQAAAIVFGAPVAHLIAVGLDVTMQCQMASEDARRRFSAAGEPLKLVADMAAVWSRHSDTMTFHDPLAAALIFDPSLCALKPERIAVEMISPRAQGQTFFDPGAINKPHEVAVSVEVAAFFDHYFETVGA